MNLSTPELLVFIKAQLNLLKLPTQVITELIQQGVDATIANELVTSLTTTGTKQELIQAGPWPTLGEQVPTSIYAYDREVAISLLVEHPKLIVFNDVLTFEECDELVALAAPSLTRSTTVDNETGGFTVHPSRTSDGMYFNRGQNPLVERIEQRLAALVNWPYDRGEGLQILRYRHGAEYLPHHDYFDPVYPGTAKVVANSGNRVGTIIIYLETPLKGGYTIFPESGLQVAPLKGSAVFFVYTPSVTSKTLHGGKPVHVGEKYVATKWLRERKF